MNTLHWIDRLQPVDRPYIGEKAWQLGQFEQEGYAVGGGFVIDARLFRSFLERLEDAPFLLADFPASSLYLDVDNFQSLQWVASHAQQAIQQAAFPWEWRDAIAQAAQQLASDGLILRSSITLKGMIAPPHSPLLAAQFCANQPLALEIAIKHTWAQLLTAKSLFYWQHKGINLTQIYLAVLVQPLEEAIASGVATLQDDHCELQAIRGLGSALRQGEAQPDYYLLDLKAGDLVRQQVGHQVRIYTNTVLPLEGSYPTPLRSQMLSPEEQNRPALLAAHLSPLIALLQQWQSPCGTLEWSLFPQESGYRIAVHQWLPQEKAISLAHPHLEVGNLEVGNLNVGNLEVGRGQPWVVGTGASPGKTTAIAHIIPLIDATVPQLPRDCILIAPHIPPHWLPSLKSLKGIVVEQGGMTCHAAILARELGIPAIVAAKGAVNRLQAGQTIEIDGQSGQIYPRTGEVKTNLPSSRSPHLLRERSSALRPQLMVSLSQRQSLRDIAGFPLDGIGLLRSELMMMDLLAERSLSQWLQPKWQEEFIHQLAGLMQSFTASVAPNPVFYRTYDQKNALDAPTRLESSELYLNAYRGTYGYGLDSRLFELELRAIRQVQRGYSNLRLVLPFVRSVAEVEFCLERLSAHGLEDVPLWIMAEVPSILFTLPQYAQLGIQGIAIGTNDLAQLLLGRDRESTFAFDNTAICPPPLLAALKQLIESARALNLGCSVCGQAPVQYPSLIPLLMEWGVTAISVEPGAVSEVYAAIAT